MNINLIEIDPEKIPNDMPVYELSLWNDENTYFLTSNQVKIVLTNKDTFVSLPNGLGIISKSAIKSILFNQKKAKNLIYDKEVIPALLAKVNRDEKIEIEEKYLIFDKYLTEDSKKNIVESMNKCSLKNKLVLTSDKLSLKN